MLSWNIYSPLINNQPTGSSQLVSGAGEWNTTRVKKGKAQRIINKATNNWEWFANYIHINKRRIWILWDKKKVEYEMIAMTNQPIHGHIKSVTLPLEFYLTALYG